MQLQLVAPNMLPDAADTAGRRLRRYENDCDAADPGQCALAAAAVGASRKILEQVADAAERQGPA